MSDLVAKQGKNTILLYRLLKKSTEEAAFRLAFQTEHTDGKSRDYNTTATKDGPIGSLSDVEYDLSATAIVSVGDKHIDDLEDAMENGDILEVWSIDKEEKGTEEENKDKYKATYRRAYITSYSTSPNSEDALELELEFGVFGKRQKGYATLTADQEQFVQYVFSDTTKATPEG